jgi:hypothetical protein
VPMDLEENVLKVGAGWAAEEDVGRDRDEERVDGAEGWNSR